jgi:hypothetical protein
MSTKATIAHGPTFHFYHEVFDSVEAPRAEQIEAGIRYYLAKREHQRRIIAAVDELRRQNRKPAVEAEDTGC